MPKRGRPSTNKRRLDGRVYELNDAFPTRAGAKGSAKDARSYGDKARVIDMGKAAGRLRYGVYVHQKRRR